MPVISLAQQLVLTGSHSLTSSQLQSFDPMILRFLSSPTSLVTHLLSDFKPYGRA